MSLDLNRLAERAVDSARRHGADEVSATASHGRSVSVQYRDGSLEQVREATSASLGVALFVDGRWSSHATSDLREEAVDAFIAQAAAMTRLLSPDPLRALPDPKLYENRPEVDLEIDDPAHEALDVGRRREAAEAAMEAARAAEGPIISVTSGWSDSLGEAVRIHSNGFHGTRRSTRFGVAVEVSTRDAGDRRPEDWSAASARFLSDLPDPVSVGRDAARRALARLGQKKLGSGRRTLVIENRVAARLLGTFLSGLGGAALHQRRTFLLDRLGTQVGSERFTVLDEPFLKRGFGSRTYDGDGMSTRRRSLVEGGRLREYLVDVYYARKLGIDPTGGSTSNLVVPPGERSLEELVASVDHGILVTSLLGGNADLTSGDFSHGVVGFEIEHGRLGAPIGEMNATGSHAELWSRLVDVGADPYPYGASRIPSLVFEDVDVSGR